MKEFRPLVHKSNTTLPLLINSLPNRNKWIYFVGLKKSADNCLYFKLARVDGLQLHPQWRTLRADQSRKKF